MRREQVAAITSTIRPKVQEPDDIAESLRRIREMGYPAVQISGMGPIPEGELMDICRDLELTICATHEGNMKFVEEPQSIVHRLDKLNCRIAGYPYPHTGTFSSREDAQRVIAALNAAGKVLHEAGKVLVYHNHDVEFIRFGEKNVLEMIYDGTDPRYVQGEPDTHWIQAGGGDPVRWCRRLRDRMPVLHMKDYTVNADRERTICPVGSGNLDWERICAAAEESGCRWYVVEHDGGNFQVLEESLRFIEQNLLD
jgi:sugar phosphate isomerase/epimerase